MKKQNAVRTPNQRRYDEILRGRGMKVGDQVVCTYRTPCPHQWWIHPWHVGVIEDVADGDPSAWNGHNTEAYHCANFLYVKVRYLGHNGSAGFTQRDQLASLLPLHATVTESPYFGSEPEEAIRLYQFACRVGLGERYAEESQKAWHELNRRKGVA